MGQLTRLVNEAASSEGGVHEIKYDGYRMHAPIDGAKIQLLTRTGLDCSHRCRRAVEVLRSCQRSLLILTVSFASSAPMGCLCSTRLQDAMEGGLAEELVLFVFDLLSLKGTDTALLPLIERDGRLKCRGATASMWLPMQLGPTGHASIYFDDQSGKQARIRKMLYNHHRPVPA